MSDIQPRTLEQLQLLADRLKQDPDYLASVFSSYQKTEQLSEAEFVEMLGIAPAEYARASLCRRPPADSHEFCQQVKQIATYADTDPHLLADIIRKVDAIQALYSRPEESKGAQSYPQPGRLVGGLLAAARDRPDHEQAAGENEATNTGDQVETEGGDDLVDE